MTCKKPPPKDVKKILDKGSLQDISDSYEKVAGPPFFYLFSKHSLSFVNLMGVSLEHPLNLLDKNQSTPITRVTKLAPNQRDINHSISLSFFIPYTLLLSPRLKVYLFYKPQHLLEL